MSYKRKGAAAPRVPMPGRGKKRKAKRAPKPPKARKAKRAKKQKLLKRYNPITGQLVRMTAEDSRVDDWPSRKPSAATRRRNAVAHASVVSRVALGVGAAVARNPASAVKSVATTARRVNAAVQAAGGYVPVVKAVGGLTMGEIAAGGGAMVAGTAALALAVGLASYYGTTWLMAHLPRIPPTREDLQFSAAQAYRKARADAAVQLGRSLTPAELTAMANEFRAKRDEINARFNFHPEP